MAEKVDLEMELEYEPEIEYVLDDGTVEEVAEPEATEEVAQEPNPQTAELEAIKAQLAAVQQNVIGKPQSASQELVDALRQLKGEGNKSEPEIDYNQFKQQFFVDPVDNVRKINELSTKETKSLIEKQNQQMNLMVQKMNILASDSSRGFYSKYSDEVEKFVETGESYEKALKLVKADHMEDLVKDAVADAMAKASEVVPEKPAVPFTNSNVPVTARPAKTQVKLTAKQVDIINRYANPMVTFEDAAEYCRDNNLI